MRERLLGRKVERVYLNGEQFKAAYAQQSGGGAEVLLGIGVAATECPEGMPLWANWNGTYVPEFKGTPLEELFPKVIEPFVEATKAAMAALSG